MGPRFPLVLGTEVAVHALDHRDEEAEGLAGAGGGGGENVAAFEGRWDGLGLNGRRHGEAGVGEAVLERVRDVEVGEAEVADDRHAGLCLCDVVGLGSLGCWGVLVLLGMLFVLF